MSQLVTFEPEAGDCIDDACRLAVFLAESMRCRVFFKFNDTPVYAVYGMSPGEVLNVYWRQRK